MKEYVVIVKLGDEAIHLEASSSEHAIERAKDIIAEQYSYDLSRSSTVSYEIKGKSMNKCDDCESPITLTLQVYGNGQMMKIECPECGVSYDTNLDPVEGEGENADSRD